MSATVTYTETDQFMGVFYAGSKGGSFDFGADPSRVFMVKEFCDANSDNPKAFFGDDSAYCFMSGQEFWARVEAREWTFGVFGGTFEVGSGHMTDWMGI